MSQSPLSPKDTPVRMSGNPHGVNGPDRRARRGILWALDDALSDEEYAEALISIVFGQWPKRTRAAGAPPKVEGPREALETAPDGTHRMQALKMIGDRKYGKPMQAIMIKAELEARSRLVENAADAIDVDALDGAAASVLEAALRRALVAGGVDESQLAGAIDAQSTEKTP